METSRLPDSLIEFHEKYGVKSATIITSDDIVWRIIFDTNDGRKVELKSTIEDTKRFVRKFYHDHVNIISDKERLVNIFRQRAYLTFARREELNKLIQSLT